MLMWLTLLLCIPLVWISILESCNLIECNADFRPFSLSFCYVGMCRDTNLKFAFNRLSVSDVFSHVCEVFKDSTYIKRPLLVYERILEFDICYVGFCNSAPSLPLPVSFIAI
jgi:hypothetical protein